MLPQVTEISDRLETWMDEYTGGVILNDPDMPYSTNPGSRRILYGPYVKFVLFPEVLYFSALFENNTY